ncbi:PIG-L family deacetylase [Cellulomonas sp. PS-H5]|uniref:PIG-L family deacetylase n=1 Tax=Cellulomonas sp. PS-H5 TaxID=2820400 RepID=UPI001C4E8346|nr:PIG-L family deacetylase [Cellulomonas sp. PS-H5]MBW0253822.1 PIG-L family deacetylase [Cellulomonas sp. PS-H5]
MSWVGTGRAGAAGEVPDGALVGVPLDVAAGRLAGLLRERRPDLVVTYEPGGGYGHPDHVRAHAITMRAVELAAGDGAASSDTSATRADGWAPAVAWAVAPAAALRAGYAALAADPTARAVLSAAADDRRATREGPLEPPDPAGPLPSVATDAPGDLVVDVLPVRDRVLAALRAHATQVQAVTPLDHPDAVACYALSNLVLAPVLPRESYAWAPGRAPAAPLPLP